MSDCFVRFAESPARPASSPCYRQAATGQRPRRGWIQAYISWQNPCGGGLSLERRPPVAPRRRLLVGVRDAQHRRVIEALAYNLERQRQAAVGITAADRHRGAAGHVEWHRE